MVVGRVRKREGLATVATSLTVEFKAIVVDYGFNSRLRTWTSCSLVVISIKHSHKTYFPTFFLIIALIIHEFGLGDKRNSEPT